MKKTRWILALFCPLVFLTGCASTPTQMHTFSNDLAELRARFEEKQSLDELPESSFLSDWEEPLIVPRSENIFSEPRDLDYRVHRVEDQYFYRTVGSMEGNNKNVLMGGFGGDVAALSWELRTGIALWEVTKESSTYHEGHYAGSYFIPGWTEHNYEYQAYFLVRIPKTDADGKEAWMIGMNVRNMDYDDRSAAGRNTGVIVTNVYDSKPAFFANVRPGHVVIKANGKDIITMEDWRRETANLQVGVPFSITTADVHGEFYTEDIIPIAIPEDEERIPPAKQSAAETVMVKVEGGKFTMGESKGAANEKPEHEVSVDTFYMCNHEVTQAEWKALMGSNPSYASDPRLDEETHPVERVTWQEAIEYCNRRSEAEGLQKVYSKSNDGTLSCDWKANGYRLPTEAEWEYAARGGKNGKDKRYAGSNNLEDVSWYASNAGFPRAVMQKKPNRLGIYDLTGNVCEWCWDKYNYDYYEKSAKENPKGASTSSFSLARVVRGASAYTITTKEIEMDRCTIFTRFHQNSKKERNRDTGLRLVRTTLD